MRILLLINKILLSNLLGHMAQIESLQNITIQFMVPYGSNRKFPKHIDPSEYRIYKHDEKYWQKKEEEKN